MHTDVVNFRAFYQNREWHQHVQNLRKMHQVKFEKASSIAAWPDYWLVGDVTLEAARSICERAIKLIELGQEAYYKTPSQNSGYWTHCLVWGNVLAYLNASDKKRNAFERFGGINNPFLTGKAKLIL